MSLKNQRTATCKGCRETIKYSFRNNQIVPRYCLECKEKYRKKWHLKNCTKCYTSFMFFEEWPFIPDLCDKCREENKTTTGNCADCGTEISYSKDSVSPPIRCDKCEEKDKKERKENVCCGCNQTFSYYPKKFHGKTPVFCPTCWKNKKENAILKTCIRCKKTFYWNKLWGEPQGGYCPMCQTAEIETLNFLSAHQSKTSWKLKAEPEFYQAIDQLLHFSEGSNDQKKHIWTDEFSGKDSSYIIQSAVELAASTQEGVLEFINNKKEYIGIKYNTRNRQMVIFNRQSYVIITTFQMNHGLRDVVRNVINLNWNKV